MTQLNHKIDNVEKHQVTPEFVSEVRRDSSERIATVKQEIRDERQARELLSDKIKGEVRLILDAVEKRLNLKTREIDSKNEKLKVWIDELKEQMKHRIQETIISGQNFSPTRTRLAQQPSQQLKQDFQMLIQDDPVTKGNSSLILSESLGEIKNAVVEMENQVDQIKDRDVKLLEKLQPDPRIDPIQQKLQFSL